MRILAFSDWRIQNKNDIISFLQNLSEPVDFILYGGDDVDRFSDEDFIRISQHAKQQKILLVYGNDDIFFPTDRVLPSYVHNLYETLFIFGDYAILGIEGATIGPGFLHTEKEIEMHLKKQYSKVKGKKIIILSHPPPNGILDLGIRFAGTDINGHKKPSHIGSKALRNFMQKREVFLIICGHSHSCGRKSTKIGNCTVINVASHDSIDAKGNFALIEIEAPHTNLCVVSGS